MKLLYVVFFLFLIFLTESLSIENNKENFTTLVDKTRNISPGLANLKRFLRQRRKFSIPEAIKDEAIIRFWNRNKKGINSSKLSSKYGARYRRAMRRIQKGNRRRYSGEKSSSSSTSEEMRIWKKKFDADWLKLKQQALLQMNASNHWHGDEMGMSAPRPWGHPCGDPEQHDWPWGTCMLPEQCDAEYRIYRGDLFCGYTSFICCSVIFSQHDLYQGLDLSFAKTSSSSSDEKSKNEIDSREKRHAKKHREKIRTFRKHRKKKQAIKRTIHHIIKRIKKHIYRVYKNTSMDHKLLMEKLKVKIKLLKKQLLEKRIMAQFRYELDVDEIQRKLYTLLVNFNKMNLRFLSNETFRAFLDSHNISIIKLRTLQQRYPKLANYVAGDGELSKGLELFLNFTMQNETSPELVKVLKKVTAATVVTNEVKIKPIQSKAASFQETDIQLAVAPDNEASLQSVPKKIKPAFEETEPTELPVNFNQKKGPRTLDALNDDISASLVYTPVSKKNPQIKGKSPLNNTAPEAAYSDAENDATETHGSHRVKDLTANNDNYVAMDEVDETRRSGRRVFDKRKEPEELKRPDYHEYDVEFGLLYT